MIKYKGTMILQRLPMNYIVIDMQWNQPYNKAFFKVKNGIVLNAEIIQIGAVKLDENREIVTAFKINIKPKKYTKINYKVKKLTKITQGEMNRGTDLHTAIDRFRNWCGDDFVFITWGYDDIPVLKTNLDFFKIPSDWIPRFYNAQIFFNQQTENRGRQYSLDFASDYFGVKTDMEAHDALNDAYHTALVCTKMDLKFGMTEYDDIVKGNIIFGEGFRGERVAEEVSCITKTIQKALDTPKIAYGICPYCKKRLKFKDQMKINENRYANLCSCKYHGDFVLFLKFSKTRGKNVHVIRNMYVIDIPDISSKFTEYKKKTVEK